MTSRAISIKIVSPVSFQPLPTVPLKCFCHCLLNRQNYEIGGVQVCRWSCHSWANPGNRGTLKTRLSALITRKWQSTPVFQPRVLWTGEAPVYSPFKGQTSWHDRANFVFHFDSFQKHLSNISLMNHSICPFIHPFKYAPNTSNWCFKHCRPWAPHWEARSRISSCCSEHSLARRRRRK